MHLNPICIGFAWSQAFDLPAGFVQPGDGWRAQFRYSLPEGALVTVSSGDGISVAGDRLTLSLTGAQTALFNKGSVVTGFVLLRGGTETPLGQIAIIPTVRYPTEPSP